MKQYKRLSIFVFIFLWLASPILQLDAFKVLAQCLSYDGITCDYDNDGVLDQDDQCVTEPGPSENNGCPYDDGGGDDGGGDDGGGDDGGGDDGGGDDGGGDDGGGDDGGGDDGGGDDGGGDDGGGDDGGGDDGGGDDGGGDDGGGDDGGGDDGGGDDGGGDDGGGDDGGGDDDDDDADTDVDDEGDDVVVYGPVYNPGEIESNGFSFAGFAFDSFLSGSFFSLTESTESSGTPTPYTPPPAIPPYYGIAPGVAYIPNGGTYEQGEINLAGIPDIAASACGEVDLPASQCESIPVYVPNGGSSPNLTGVITGDPLLFEPQFGAGDPYGDTNVVPYSYYQGQLYIGDDIPGGPRVDPPVINNGYETVEYTGGEWQPAVAQPESTVLNVNNNVLTLPYIDTVTEIGNSLPYDLWSPNGTFSVPGQVEGIDPVTGEVIYNNWNNWDELLEDAETLGQTVQSYVSAVQQTGGPSYPTNANTTVPDAIGIIQTNLMVLDAMETRAEIDATFDDYYGLDGVVTIEIQVFVVTDPDGTAPDQTVRAVVTFEQSVSTSNISTLEYRDPLFAPPNADIQFTTHTNEVTSYVGADGLTVIWVDQSILTYNQTFNVSASGLRPINP